MRYSRTAEAFERARELEEPLTLAPVQISGYLVYAPDGMVHGGLALRCWPDSNPRPWIGV